MTGITLVLPSHLTPSLLLFSNVPAPGFGALDFCPFHAPSTTPHLFEMPPFLLVPHFFLRFLLDLWIFSYLCEQKPKNKVMGMTRLYKYLDVTGGLAMLEHHNLQFTNASKFNDPFDCHPALFDYSHAPVNKNNWPPADFLSKKREIDMVNLRNHTWICCLSKEYDSLLMWAYYNSHKGICIGLNVEEVIQSCQHGFLGMMPPSVAEVKYKDILQKPDYFKDNHPWIDLWTTKAKAWEHEQEVRLITKEPFWLRAGRDIPDELKDDEIVDGKEIRYYPELSADCFESVYLGVKIDKKKKEDIVNAAYKCNPSIKIYQMTTDPEAFRLVGVEI